MEQTHPARAASRCSAAAAARWCGHRRGTPALWRSGAPRWPSLLFGSTRRRYKTGCTARRPRQQPGTPCTARTLGTCCERRKGSGGGQRRTFWRWLHIVLRVVLRAQVARRLPDCSRPEASARTKRAPSVEGDPEVGDRHRHATSNFVQLRQATECREACVARHDSAKDGAANFFPLVCCCHRVVVQAAVKGRVTSLASRKR